ncbi:MAG: NUDIX domain-containing protein [Vicinamibacteria bacterium]|nr:NUDIX domain-containing protein [Vicinamibacteria bacterium]
MPQISAGLLLFRQRDGQLEVLLVHPGGPFWRNKDLGAWSIPKGECAPGEDPLLAARRELREETGFDVDGPFTALQPVRQAGGKIVQAWAAQADLDPSRLVSNTFTTEWPPRSGRQQEFPEVDRAAWFALDEARVRILSGQTPLLDELVTLVS